MLIVLLAQICQSAKWPLDSSGNPTPGAIETFYMDPQNLWENRNLYIQGNTALNPAIKRVIRLADQAVADNTTYSVVNKPQSQLPPSGNASDFYSLARYYWPNSTGGVYIRLDGITNPEIYTLPDSTWIQVMINDVFNCALAYFFTGTETYAAKATTRLRDWFINPNTAMNPNLNFANWVKGTDIGQITGTVPIVRSGGILDFSTVYMIVDAIGILKNSKSYTVSDNNSLITWFTLYLKWLQSSPRGAFESAAQNNQGTWYDVQQVSILLFLGQSITAKQVQSSTTVGRISTQIMPDGSQPLEQVRTMSWFYSNFNLQAYFVHGALSKTTLAQVFEFSTQDGRSIFHALDYLVGFGLSGGANWPVSNIGGYSPASTAEMCKETFVQLYDVKYLQEANQMTGRVMTWNVHRLWAPFGSFDSKSVSTAGRLGIRSKQDTNDQVRFVGTEKVSLNRKFVIMHNEEMISGLDISTGEVAWERSYAGITAQSVSKRESALLVVSGKNSEFAEWINASNGVSRWKFLMAFEVNGHIDRVRRTAYLHEAEAVFYDYSKDGKLKTDVLVLSATAIISRVNGETGVEVWHWVSDRGNIKFQSFCLHRGIIYMIGGNVYRGKPELALVGIDPETGMVYSSDYEPLPNHDQSLKIFMETVSIIGFLENKYMFWKTQDAGNFFDVIIRSLYKAKHYSLRSNVGVLQDIVCESLDLVNFHSENFQKAEFGLKCINSNQTDQDFIVRITGTEEEPRLSAFKLHEADSTNQAELMFAARDYSEPVTAIARIHLINQTAIVLEFFDVEDGAIIYNVEIDIKVCALKVGDAISKRAMWLRQPKFSMEELRGLDKELYEKQMSKFDASRQAEAISFIEQVSGIKVENPNDFQGSLKSGVILATAMNSILTVRGDTSKLITISHSKMAFKQMEMIGNFLDRLSFLGVKSHETFQTVDLYENKNMVQVIDSIFALSRTVHHLGFPLLGPKLAEKNTRKFTREQLDASRSAVPLLSKFTSKSGNNSGMGNIRQVFNPELGVGDTITVTKLMGGLEIENSKKKPLGISFGKSRQIGGMYQDKENESEGVEQAQAQYSPPQETPQVLYQENDRVQVKDDCVKDDDFYDGYYGQISPT